jgi:intracellular sulfur oxidation DsrE/DsrF family protein
MKLLKILLIFVISLLILNATLEAKSNKDFRLKKVIELQDKPSDRFPGDPAEHKAVFMWNKSDAKYQKSILNSIKALIKKYDDNVDISVVVISYGISALMKKPKLKVDKENYIRIESFAKDYNVRWIVCGNTMNTLHLKDKDIRDFAYYVEVGASALMELQEEGYKLLVW